MNLFMSFIFILHTFLYTFLKKIVHLWASIILVEGMNVTNTKFLSEVNFMFDVMQSNPSVTLVK